MKCKYCKRKIIIDQDGDYIHSHLDEKGVDPRMCDPKNLQSTIAQSEVRD